LAYFAAILHMADPERNQTLRPQHLEYVGRLDKQGQIHLAGPFADGTGGMVIYIADTLAEAEVLAKNDPYVAEGVRRLELHEWKI
jgi:uncharacterized protein